MKRYIFSRTIKESPDERVEIVAENAGELVRKLKTETGSDIYLCGGADLATELFAEGLIDEVILKVNPVLLGTGIPLVIKKIGDGLVVDERGAHRWCWRSSFVSIGVHSWLLFFLV